MITPSILPELFASPFDHVRFPVTYPNLTHSMKCINERSESSVAYNLMPNISSQFDAVYVQEHDLLPTVHASSNDGSMLILAHRVFGHIMLHDRGNKALASKIGLSYVTPGEWYDMCIPNLFQPTYVLRELLQPYEQKLLGKFVVGVHIRRAGKLAEWRDGVSYLSDRNLLRMKKYVEKIARRHPNLGIFIASDSLQVIKQFQSWFDIVVTTNDYALEHVGRNPSYSGLIRSSLDLMLLSQSDVLLLTKNSQFSSVSHHLATHSILVKYF